MSAIPATSTRNPAETQQRLIVAAVRLILLRGFAGTTVDQICAEAGLTKGSFFHHFASKEAIGKAAVEWWGRMGAQLYSPAWHAVDADPLQQLHQLLDIMIGFTLRPEEPCVCVVGMMSQELSRTNPIMREACTLELNTWTEKAARLLAGAKQVHPPKTDFDPVAVAWFLNSLWQGSMLIAKTRDTPEMIRSNLQLARHFVDGLFGIKPS